MCIFLKLLKIWFYIFFCAQQDDEENFFFYYNSFYLPCLFRTCPVCIWFNEYIFKCLRISRGIKKQKQIVITFE